MTERARLLGGTLSAGDAPQGGFVVRVRVPFTVDAAEGGAAPAAVGGHAGSGVIGKETAHGEER